MAVVPTPPTFEVGVSDTTELNELRDAVNYLLDKPAFTLYANANQSLSNATYTALLLATEALDDDPDGTGGHDTVTNTSRFTARYPGWYAVAGTAGYASNATGLRQAALYVNGVVVTGSLVSIPAASGNVALATATIRLFLEVGDYVEVYGWQNSTGALNTGQSSGYIPSLSGEWCRLT